MVVVGLAAGWLFSSQPVEVAAIGSPAPDFTVPVIDGDDFSLSDARGSKVVLNFWASWCGPCREEIPAISAFASANPDITVIGVAVEDTENAATDFAREIDASYPLMIGDRAVEDAYPRLGLPVTYIIDERGVVTDVFNGIVNEETLTDLAG